MEMDSDGDGGEEEEGVLKESHKHLRHQLKLNVVSNKKSPPNPPKVGNSLTRHLHLAI
jgi:hypothetical protein